MKQEESIQNRRIVWYTIVMSNDMRHDVPANFIDTISSAMEDKWVIALSNGYIINASFILMTIPRYE